MRRARSARRVAGAALALLLAACTGSGKHPVAGVEVQGATVQGNALLGMTPPQVEALVLDVVRGHGRFTVVDSKSSRVREAKGADVPVTLVLEVPFTRESEKAEREGPHAEVGVLLTVRRKVDGVTHRYELEGFGQRAIERPADPQARQEAMRAALEEAVRSAVDGAHVQLRALRSKDAALVAKLEGGEGPEREAALAVLTERGHPAAVDVLIERLGSDAEPDQVRRAMGALAELREERAVRPLIESTRGRDAGFIREVVFALAQIGGEEATAYVFTVAQGHDDPLVRAAAEQALGELQSRTAGGEER